MNLNKSGLIAVCIFSAFSFLNCGEDEPQTLDCVSLTFPRNEQLVPGGQTIMMRWESSSDASGYDVFIGEGAESPVLYAENIQETQFELEVSLVENTTYSWYVSPRNANGKHPDCSSRTTAFSTKSLPDFETNPKEIDVLVLCFDPMVVEGSTTRLHEQFQWGDPRTLAEEFIKDVRFGSHDLINYNIVEWKDINDFPMKADGFKYTFQTYSTCISNHATCHTPDDLDYRKIFQDYNVLDGIDNDVYDEVWILGAPYFGFWESAMAGREAFYINGGVFPEVDSKAFAIMGFSYERGVGEMLHNLCHRTEATMSYLYGGWQAENLSTSWAEFAANKKQSGVAAVGSCHYPPNANEDYDYCNEQQVMSSADDWYNYPYLTGAMTPVSVYTWGLGDCQREYLKWWFHHLPYRTGQAPDGKLNCWWNYIYELPD